MNELTRSTATLLNAEIASEDELRRFVSTVKGVMDHGIVEASVDGGSYSWRFLRRLPDCLPDGQKVIDEVIATTAHDDSLDATVVFIRKALRDGELGEYLTALLWNDALVQ